MFRASRAWVGYRGSIMVSCINLHDTDKAVSYAGDYEHPYYSLTDNEQYAYEYEEPAEEEYPHVDY